MLNSNYDSDILTDMSMGSLCLMPLRGTEAFTKEIDEYIRSWRIKNIENLKLEKVPDGYVKDTFIATPTINRFGSGEAKGLLTTTVRGYDIFIIVDVTNYSESYNLFGTKNRMSPDDHFQDLKRVIAATNGKAKRINVIMPFLYESRQHNRTARESLDCAMMLQ